MLNPFLCAKQPTRHKLRKCVTCHEVTDLKGEMTDEARRFLWRRGASVHVTFLTFKTFYTYRNINKYRRKGGVGGIKGLL